MNKDFLKNQREKIAAASFFLIIGGFVYFVVVPLLGKITSIKDEIEAGTIKQEMVIQRFNELPKIRQQYSEIMGQQEDVDVLLNKSQAVILIERLEKLAQDTNNKIVISTQEDLPQKVQATAKGKSDSSATILVDSLPSKDYLKFKISLSGDYDGLYRFVSSLETLEYYSDITEISIGHPAADGSSGSSATRNSDVLNPFGNQSAASESSAVFSKKDSGKIDTSLGVVFYVKK